MICSNTRKPSSSKSDRLEIAAMDVPTGPRLAVPSPPPIPGADVVAPAAEMAESPETRADVERARARDGGASGRAGRNLVHATGVGVALAALVLTTLFTRKVLFEAVVIAAMLVAVWEMRAALAHRQFNVPIVPIGLGAISMSFGAYSRGPEPLVMAFGLTVIAILLWRVADGVAGAARDIAAGVLIAFYPCFLGGFAGLMLAEDDGQWRIVVFILVTVCSDMGGYIAGVFFGKHPMAPRVSPKKSWEGFAGSVLFCAVVGGASVAFMLGGSWIGGALLGCVVAACATVGDLMESSIKRDLGIKDMGDLLPGHGGLMDRLDSLLITAPIVWASLLFLVP